MTLKEAEQFFYLFRDIKDCRDANAYLAFKKRSVECYRALRFYCAKISCMQVDTKYQNVYEVVRETKEIRLATIRMDAFITMKSVVRRQGCEYYLDYSLENLKRKLNL